MAELKTKPHQGDVHQFIESIEHPKRKEDSKKLLNIFDEILNEEPVLWGPSIIGFGSYHYKYPTGREGDWFLAGFSPRKQNMTLYIMAGFENYEELLSKLGKYKTGKSCLYINKLEDVNIDVLKKLIKESAQHVSQIKW